MTKKRRWRETNWRGRKEEAKKDRTLGRLEGDAEEGRLLSEAIEVVEQFLHRGRGAKAAVVRPTAWRRATLRRLPPSTKAPQILTPLGMPITEARGRTAHTLVTELCHRLRTRVREREAIMEKDVVGRSGTFVVMGRLLCRDLNRYSRRDTNQFKYIASNNKYD